MSTATAGPIAPFVDSMPDLDRPEVLSDRLERDGYLFLAGLLPRRSVLDVRRRMLDVIGRHGWLAPGTDPMDAVADPDRLDRDPGARDGFSCCELGQQGYLDIYRIEAFHQLAHHPALLGLYRSLLGQDAFPHPRNIARIAIPTTTAATTPPHQDFIHVQGSPQTMTAWIPLGDCPTELGSLSVLAGSQREGILSYKPSDGAGALEAQLCELEYPWVQGDFAAGDVVTFDSRTVHKALPNQLADRIRLSVDFRYQSIREPIEAKSLEPHCHVGAWDEIYAGWSDPSVQHYWQSSALSFSAWDESVRWQQDRIC